MRPVPIGWFVSSHGFGHAARSCAVMEAAYALEPAVEYHVFSAVPPWFFRDSLSAPFTLHSLDVDPGLVQRTAIEEDLEASSQLALHTLSETRMRASDVAADLVALGCRGVVADIAPLGMEAGRLAGLPTAVVDNFTWDQVFMGFSRTDPARRATWDELATAFRRFLGGIELRIRAEPSVPIQPSGAPEAARSAEVAPIARAPRTDPDMTRRAIGVPKEVPLALVTLGGVGGAIPQLDRLTRDRGLFFVIPGMPEWGFGSNTLHLPTRSGYFHPDLVAAADVVVGKLGYSTLAECHLSNTRYAYFPRPGFVETPSLARWLDRRGLGYRLPAGSLEDGGWVEEIHSVLALQTAPQPPPPENGARKAARLILELVAATR